MIILKTNCSSLHYICKHLNHVHRMASSSKTVSKRVVGWYNRDEWKAVYQELFCENLQSQRHALDKIAVWKCRGLHKLPTAIECSAELVRAKIMDLQQMELGLESHEVKLTMAMAVIRFVNLITEKHQNRSYAQSVHMLAEKLGLPEWLVDLRHDATHSSLPSLSLLRAATAFSIGWLQDRYWAVEDVDEEAESSQSDSSFSKPAPLEADVATRQMETLLEEYVSLQIQNNTKTAKQKKDNKEVRQILNKIERLAVSNREQALHCLVQDRFLVPTPDQLAGYNISSEEFMAKNDLQLSNELVDSWRPCLKLFHHLLLTQQLLQLLSISITTTDSDNLRNKMLAGWLLVILKNTKDPETVSKSHRLYNNGCDVDCQHLLRNIVKSPNLYTNRLLESLFDLDDCGLDDTQKKQIISCLKLYTNTSQTVESVDHTEQYTVKDLMQYDLGDNTLGLEEMGDKSQEGNSAWVLATDVLDWSKYPLGSCPGVNITYTNLELFTGNLDDASQAERSDDSDSMDYSSETVETHEESELVRQTGPVWSKERLNTVVNSIKLY